MGDSARTWSIPTHILATMPDSMLSPHGDFQVLRKRTRWLRNRGVLAVNAYDIERERERRAGTNEQTTGAND